MCAVAAARGHCREGDKARVLDGRSAVRTRPSSPQGWNSAASFDVCPFVRRRPKNVRRAVRGGARQERFYERWLPLLSAARPRKRLAAAGPAAGRLENSL